MGKRESFHLMEIGEPGAVIIQGELETALLQRCRDYFEESADEVLAKVGISDVDRYLEALKHKIDNPYQE